MTDSPFTPDLDALLEHGGWVRALAFSLTADASTAEDVEQKTWLAAMERPPSKATNSRAWLGAVVRNVAGMHWREQKARRRREKVVGENRCAKEAIRAVDAQPDSLADRLDTFRKLAVALAKLPDPYGGTLYLRFFEELTVREIAERMHVPESTAQARITRGLSRLRGELTTTLGKDWRNRCLVFTVPLTQAAKLGSLTTVLAMTLKMKILVGAAALAIVSLLAYQPWVSSGAEKPILEEPIVVIGLEKKTEELPPIGDSISIERHSLNTVGEQSSGLSASTSEQQLIIQIRDAKTLEAVAGADVFFLDRAVGNSEGQRNKPENQYLGPEKRLEQFGVQHKSDKDGALLLPYPEEGADVAVRIDNRFGYREHHPKYFEKGQVLEILLYEVQHQRVIVVDERGQPAEGVEVGFSAQVADNARHADIEALTNQDGIAELRHLEQHIRYSLTGNNTIGLLLPCKTPQSVVLSGKEIGKQDIHFIMPATGTVEVVYRSENGAPLEDGAYIRLQTDVEMERFSLSIANGSQVTRVKNGVAIFPLVGVGTKLIASTFLNSRDLTSKGMGPTRQGDVARFDLILPNQTPPVRVQLVQSDLSPIREMELTGTLHYSNRKNSFLKAFPYFNSDPDGWIEICADFARQVGSPRLRTLIAPHRSSVALGQLPFAFLDVDLVAHEQSSESFELVLGESTIVAGVVVNSQGSPVADQTVELGFRYIGGPKDLRGYMERSLVLQTDAEGNFIFSGPSNPNLYSYTLVYDQATIPFRLGQEDLRIRKRGEQNLWGRVLLDDREWSRNLRLWAVIPSSSAQSKEVRLDDVRIENSNGRFRLKGLPNEGVELQLRQFNGFGVLARLPLSDLNLEMTPDGKRIPDWDLRGKLFQHTIHLDVEGEAFPLYFIHVISDLGTAYARWEPGQSIQLLASEPSLNMELLAHPYRIQAFNSTGEVNVFLSKGIPIQLSLPAGILVPPDSAWLIKLTKLGSRFSQEEMESFGWLSENSIENHEILVPGPGLWNVALTLVAENRAGPEQPKVLFGDGLTSFAIEVQDSKERQTFIIPLDAGALEEAIALKQ